ncbi:hypothetical protein V1512DRAFT_259380 [Lipomyces arxii]|uniref:uncharacterized protein n=1 Tax=Lipomyces arxii TaxID=56418 RepID=UPI0034CFD878
MGITKPNPARSSSQNSPVLSLSPSTTATSSSSKDSESLHTKFSSYLSLVRRQSSLIMHSRSTNLSSTALSEGLLVPEIVTETEIDTKPSQRRAVSFDERSLSPEHLHPERATSRGRWGRRLSSRSPSPARGSKTESSTSPTPRSGSMASTDLDSRMSKLDLNSEEKPKRRSHLFKKHFDPDEPESDSEIKTRQQIREALDFVRSQRIGMMTSRNAKNQLVSSAFAVALIENGIDIIFHANSRTCNIEDIDNDPHMNLSFQNNETAEWISIAGTAKIVSDEKNVDRYMRATVKDWVDGKTFAQFVQFTTHTIAYCVSESFDFVPTSSANGITKGEIRGNTSTIKIDERAIKQYRKRIMHKHATHHHHS